MTAFKIAKAEILRGVRLARGIAEKKGTLPILSNILLRAHGPQGLSLIATDLNVSLTAELESANTAEGGILIGAANLYEIVSNAPGDEISLTSAANSWAEIRSGKAKYRVVGMPDKDFPLVPDRHATPLTMIESAVLREMIDRVAFAVCPDDSRTNITGALFESDGTEARMVTTDGHRLCKVVRRIAGPRLAAGVIIPKKGLGELKKLTEQGPSIGLAVADHHLFATQDDITIAIKLPDLQFAVYEPAFALVSGHTNAVTIDRVRLLEALKRQFMTTEMRGVKLVASAGSVVLSGDHPDHGEVVEGLDAEVVGIIAIGFNPRYVMELLSQMTSDHVVVRVGGAVDPLVVVPMSGDDYTGIVMPMRVDP